MMPLISFNGLTESEKTLATGIVATQGKNKGRLRASKPKIEYTFEVKNGRKLRIPTAASGSTAYIWRQVAFIVSPISQHQCLPILADFDLPGDWQEARLLAKELDVIADKIVNSIPKSQWVGVLRWRGLVG